MSSYEDSLFSSYSPDSVASESGYFSSQASSEIAIMHGAPYLPHNVPLVPYSYNPHGNVATIDNFLDNLRDYFQVPPVSPSPMTNVFPSQLEMTDLEEEEEDEDEEDIDPATVLPETLDDSVIEIVDLTGDSDGEDPE